MIEFHLDSHSGVACTGYVGPPFPKRRTLPLRSLFSSGTEPDGRTRGTVHLAGWREEGSIRKDKQVPGCSISLTKRDSRARELLSSPTSLTTMPSWCPSTPSCKVGSDGSSLSRLSIVMVQPSQDRN